MAESSAASLHLVRTQSLASLVGRELERMILEGELPPGARLNELALAARLGVSRGPVREAVRGLDRSGLVVTVVNQGSFVRQLSEAEALHLYDLRAALTGHACATLAGRASAAQRAALQRLVAAMDEAAEGEAAPRYYALNLEFHAALLELAGNPRAARLYEDLGKELSLYCRRALLSPEQMRDSNTEHAAMLAALGQGPDAARAAAEAHIRGGWRRFREGGGD